jgi:hypothetical protein
MNKLESESRLMPGELASERASVFGMKLTTTKKGDTIV